MGTWQFGGPNYVAGKPTGWGAANERDATDAIHRALALGATFFDTADSYGAGQAEEWLGRALRSSAQSADNVVICTKFGNRHGDAGPFQEFSATYLTEAVEASLRRLGRERLDVLLLHSPPDGFDWASYDPAPFDDLVKAGKLGVYGVSSKSVYGARNVVNAGFGSVLEVIYNVLDRRAEDVLFTHSDIEKYSVIARVPLASGFLNATYLAQDPAFPEDDYRHFLPDRDRNWMLESVRNVQFLDELPGGIATSALRFCLSNEHVAVVIPGARNAGQVEVQQRAAQLGPLPPDMLARIRTAVLDVPAHWKPSTV